MAEYFLGIDFGTTNSAVYVISAVNNSKEDEFTIGENEQIPLPSYVAIHRKTGEVVTGLSAKNSILEGEDYQVFSSIKSIIGEEREWEIAGKIWTPVDIAAELFMALKIKVEKTIKETVEQAVVAVPVGFSPKKKSNLRKAAANAGITVIMFISEPTAAYCSRMDEMKKFSNVAVFDWGGGTLDVSVLHIQDGAVNELATKGLPVAGNDIDKKLAERICLQASKKNHIDFGFDDLSKETQQRILQKCEVAKCNLADTDTATITELKLDNYGRMLERIDYDSFALLIEEEVKQAVCCLLEALSEAGMNKGSIDCILCVGGSSRLRPLQEEFLQYFDKEQLLFPRKAMWDIAAGAALIAFNPGCYTLNKSIGILQSNNKFYPLLRTGQRVPTEEDTIYFGVIDSSEEARFIITDGENKNSQSFLEYFTVKLRGFSDEVIEVMVSVDQDMVFHMKVRSNRMPKGMYRRWSYSNLKFSYKIDAPVPEKYSRGYKEGKYIW